MLSFYNGVAFSIELYQNGVSHFRIQCFFDPYKFVPKYCISKNLSQNLFRLFQNRSNHGRYKSPCVPLRKKILVPRTKARKRRDGVITLVWQLQSQKDTDHNVFPISNLFVMAQEVNAQNSEVSSHFKQLQGWCVLCVRFPSLVLMVVTELSSSLYLYDERVLFCVVGFVQRQVLGINFRNFVRSSPRTFSVS